MNHPGPVTEEAEVGCLECPTSQGQAKPSSTLSLGMGIHSATLRPWANRYIF